MTGPLIGVAAGTNLRAGRWELVSSLTSVRFAARNFGIATVHGQFPVTDAWVDVDDSGRLIGVHARLDVTGVQTGNARRDGHLRSVRMLDAARHPEIAFDAETIAQVGAAEWRLSGTLSAHGVTIPLDVQASAPRSGAGQIAVCAHSELDRRAVGVAAPRVLIGHRIAIDIDAAFTPPA